MLERRSFVAPGDDLGAGAGNLVGRQVRHVENPLVGYRQAQPREQVQAVKTGGVFHGPSGYNGTRWG